MRKNFSWSIRQNGKSSAAVLAALLLCSGLLLADDQSIDFDGSVDFSRIKTFAFREGKALTNEPEINNTLFLKRVLKVIRAGLTGKGLEERSNGADLLIDYSVAGLEYSVVGGTRGTRIPDAPGIRGAVIPGTGPQPVRFSEGTLIVDLTMRGSNQLVWRGVYRDEENNVSRLAKKLPVDAGKLMSEYPPKKRK
jgi:hypothetical protein